VKKAATSVTANDRPACNDAYTNMFQSTPAEAGTFPFMTLTTNGKALLTATPYLL
jgi:hypothetical protein